MEFTVAIDYYMRPWTHDLVDMLLPAAMCYERMAPPAIFGRKISIATGGEADAAKAARIGRSSGDRLRWASRRSAMAAA